MKLLVFGLRGPGESAVVGRGGWASIADMVKRFDGCVFHVNTSVPGKHPESLTWLGWGRREFKLEEFQGTLKDLAANPPVNSNRQRTSFDGKLLELPDAYVQSIRRAREKYCKD